MSRPFVNDEHRLKPRGVALSDVIYSGLEKIAAERGVSINSLIVEACEAKVRRWKKDAAAQEVSPQPKRGRKAA